jgi:hypothetical protein
LPVLQTRGGGRHRIGCRLAVGLVEAQVRDGRWQLQASILAPGVKRRAGIACKPPQACLDQRAPLLYRLVPGLLVRRPQQQRGCGRGAREVRVQPRFVDAVEERRQREVVALGDGVELVVVTAGALERQAEHRGTEGVDTVRNVLDAELLFDAAALVRLPVQPVERGGYALVTRGRGQQVAG